MALCFAACCFAAGRIATAEVVIAKDGAAFVDIVINPNRSEPPERTAADELAVTLHKMTGARFRVVDEQRFSAGSPAIYVGDTEFARNQGIEPQDLGAEESVLRTSGAGLIVVGGRPRGTLYSIYELLDDVLGCRWYTPWYEKIPKQRNVVLSAMNRRSQPAFHYRYAYTHLNDPRIYPNPTGWTRFAVANRLNGPGPNADWGGSICGGRSENHSFARLLPSKQYFSTHPEYFSERQGKRVPDSDENGNQLCLTNPNVLAIVVEEVRKDFRDHPSASYVSVSINDGGCRTICDCARCRQVAAEEGESGLLLQFVNAVADAVKEEHPDKYILTLAYNPTACPPKRIRARDNVIVFLCEGGQSALVYFPKGIEASEFQPLRKWTNFAKHVWIWDYACANHFGMHFFRPLLWQMHRQFSFYHQLGAVEGILQENEFTGGTDVLFPQFYEMNLWIFARLCREPDQRLDGLIDDFVNGYYDKAAPAIRRYVDLLKTRVPRYPYRMFDYEFAAKSQSCFDDAESAAGQNPELLARVKDLRLHLDLATLAWRNDIIRDYLARGGCLQEYPFRQMTLKERLLDRLAKTRHPLLRANTLRYYPTGPAEFVAKVEPVLPGLKRYIEVLASGKEYAELPEPFRRIASDRLIDLSAATFGWNSPRGPHVQSDPEGTLGLAVARMGDNELPMPIGVYGVDAGERRINLTSSDIKGPGYQWYRGPRFTLTERSYVYLTRSWVYQTELWSEYDPANTGQQWDVYVSMKAAGSGHPHGKSEDHSGVFFDRMILVRTEPEEKPLLP